MRLAGRGITLLLMLAPAALTAYLGGADTAWLIGSALLLVAGLGAGLALVATWRGEHAYAQPVVAVRPEPPNDPQRLEAVKELSGDLAILAGPHEALAEQVIGSGRRLDLVLTRPGRNRIAVIKEVRALRGCGLREAKDIVDGATRTPAVLGVQLPAAEARRIHKALTDAGATAELRDPGQATR